jgi:hypothetical protein
MRKRRGTQSHPAIAVPQCSPLGWLLENKGSRDGFGANTEGSWAMPGIGKASRSPDTQESRHPTLVAIDLWADEHGDLLAGCFRLFVRDHEWPTLERLQHDFELGGQRIEVAALSKDMPALLGFVEDQRLVLRVRGLAKVAAAEPLLEDWHTVNRHAFRLWLQSDSATVGRSDVVRWLDDDEGRAAAVSKLLLRESWALGSGTGDAAGDWTREIRSNVRIVGSTRSAAQLIGELDALEFQNSVEDVPEDLEQRRSRLRRFWELISNNQLIAALVAAGILALVGAGIRELSTRRHPRSTALRGHVEQAGAGGARTFFGDPRQLAQPGVDVKPGQHVRVICRIYAPNPPTVRPDGFWYLIATKPWSGLFYAPANSFMNGDILGHRPYTHNTDLKVPICRSSG